MRALIVTNMYPSARSPARGSFVRDQVRALERIPGVELELFAFEPGGASPYPRAAARLRRRYGHHGFDVVHAHFGLTAWPALAVRGGASHLVTLHGTDLVHPVSRAVTLAALPFLDLVAPVSEPLKELLPPRLEPRKVEILPCGVDTERFKPIPRDQARAALNLPPGRRLLFFPADASRPDKRHDRALAVAGEIPLLSAGRIDPEEMPLWFNAADAVLIPSERESFGLSVLEALACNVPVLATPVGVAPEVLAGVEGALCAPFALRTWHQALAQILEDADPRVEGRVVAEPYSATVMARRVLEAWRQLSR